MTMPTALLQTKESILSIQNLSTNASPAFAALTAELEKDIPLDVLRVLTRSSMAALSVHMPAEARLIVDGLHPHFTRHPAVAMARVTVTIASGQPAEALQMVESLLQTHPQLDAALCCCALLKKSMGVPGWRVLAQRVISRGADADAVGMAEEMLAVPHSRGAKLQGVNAALAAVRFA
jgi:Bacterial type III secretion protein (HrpB1_HrpK)